MESCRRLDSETERGRKRGVSGQRKFPLIIAFIKGPKAVQPVLLPKDEGVPEMSDIIKQKLVLEAQNLTDKTNGSSDFIYFVLVNKAYERMTLNWICNTAMMENVHNRTLIVSMDQSTCTAIRSQWDETIKCVSLDLDNYKQGYDWGKQEYINILTLRVNVMELLTSSGISYVLFETDATWFKDPFELFSNRTSSFEDFDIVVPVKGYDGGKWDTLAFDPMIVKATNGSKMFMAEMKERLSNDTTLYDQVCLFKWFLSNN